MYGVLLDISPKNSNCTIIVHAPHLNWWGAFSLLSLASVRLSYAGIRNQLRNSDEA